uniref:Uncharacterized protein n=1 Tax=Pygocentrus nattereri TaxID=42514 RepID=A0AAR2IZG0_PYGNA
SCCWVVALLRPPPQGSQIAEWLMGLLSRCTGVFHSANSCSPGMNKAVHHQCVLCSSTKKCYSDLSVIVNTMLQYLENNTHKMKKTNMRVDGAAATGCR